MDAEHTQFDRELLERLSRLESAIQRNSAIAELVRYLEAQHKQGRFEPEGWNGIGAESPLQSLLPAEMPVTDNQQAITQQTTTIAEHPLAGHLLGLIPYEYQSYVSAAMQSGVMSKRNLLLAAVAIGSYTVYSGKVVVSMPESLKALVTTTKDCPATVIVPMPIVNPEAKQ